MSKPTPITIEMLEASEINEVRLGGKVTNMQIKEGNQKMGQDGNPLHHPNGDPILWDNSYFIEFSFQGGVNNFKVTREQYETVELNKRYQFVGRAFMKTPYGEGKPYLSIEPLRFDFLF